MSDEDIFEQNVLEFRDKYLKDRRDVSLYRKLKRYSKLGLYATGFSTYITIGLYFGEDYGIFTLPFMIVICLSLVSGMITVLFWLNKRKRYDYDDVDLVYHEVAVFIDDFEHAEGEEELLEGVKRFEEYVIEEDEGILPRVWKNELHDYFNHIKESESDLHQNVSSVFSKLISDLEGFSQLELNKQNVEEEQTTGVEDELGFVGVLNDAVTSDVISHQAVIWVIFLLAVAGGLGLAIIQGQGWGVLLVTIVFAGLRLYDKRGD